MTLKEIAAEIYKLHPGQRAKRLAEIEVPDRGMVKAYIDQMAKRDQIANSRRNAVKAGLGLPPRKAG